MRTHINAAEGLPNFQVISNEITDGQCLDKLQETTYHISKENKLEGSIISPKMASWMFNGK